MTCMLGISKRADHHNYEMEQVSILNTAGPDFFESGEEAIPASEEQSDKGRAAAADSLLSSTSSRAKRKRNEEGQHINGDTADEVDFHVESADKTNGGLYHLKTESRDHPRSHDDNDPDYQPSTSRSGGEEEETPSSRISDSTTKRGRPRGSRNKRTPYTAPLALANLESATDQYGVYTNPTGGKRLKSVGFDRLLFDVALASKSAASSPASFGGLSPLDPLIGAAAAAAAAAGVGSPMFGSGGGGSDQTIGSPRSIGSAGPAADYLIAQSLMAPPSYQTNTAYLEPPAPHWMASPRSDQGMPQQAQQQQQLEAAAVLDPNFYVYHHTPTSQLEASGEQVRSPIQDYYTRGAGEGGQNYETEDYTRSPPSHPPHVEISQSPPPFSPRSDTQEVLHPHEQTQPSFYIEGRPPSPVLAYQEHQQHHWSPHSPHEQQQQQQPLAGGDPGPIWTEAQPPAVSSSADESLNGALQQPASPLVSLSRTFPYLHHQPAPPSPHSPLDQLYMHTPVNTESYAYAPLTNSFLPVGVSPHEPCVICGQSGFSDVNAYLCRIPACRRVFCRECVAKASAKPGNRVFDESMGACIVCTYQLCKRSNSCDPSLWHFEFRDEVDAMFVRMLRDILPQSNGLFIEISRSRQPCWRRKVENNRKHSSFKFYGGIFEARLEALDLRGKNRNDKNNNTGHSSHPNLIDTEGKHRLPIPPSGSSTTPRARQQGPSLNRL